MKSTLTAHGTKRLKLKCDGPLSSSAFKCKLRRYTVGLGAATAVGPFDLVVAPRDQALNALPQTSGAALSVGHGRHCSPRHRCELTQEKPKDSKFVSSMTWPAICGGP